MHTPAGEDSKAIIATMQWKQQRTTTSKTMYQLKDVLHHRERETKVPAVVRMVHFFIAWVHPGASRGPMVNCHLPLIFFRPGGIRLPGLETRRGFGGLQPVCPHRLLASYVPHVARPRGPSDLNRPLLLVLVLVLLLFLLLFLLVLLPLPFVFMAAVARPRPLLQTELG